MRGHVVLAVVGVLVGAALTVPLTTLASSASTEVPGPAELFDREQLGVVHAVADAERRLQVREQARAEARAAAAADRARLRRLRAVALRQVHQQRWVVPVAGYALSAGFGETGQHWLSGRHTGQDFVVPYGTAVHAAHAGTVTFAGWGGRYGNVVEITHDDGVESWYAHLSQVGTSLGAQVATGAVIGATGCSGNCFGTHLHFEVRLGHDTPVDPLEWFALRHVRV